MKILSSRLGHIIAQGSGWLALLYFTLWLASAGFKYSVHWLSGIRPADLELRNYLTPDPDPDRNFCSVLGYDFENPGPNRRFIPAGMPSFSPSFGPVGRELETGSSIIPWPWTGDFSAFFDVEATAASIREALKEPRPEASQEALAYWAKILDARSPLETCERTLSIWRPFFTKLATGLPKPESINPFPYELAFTADGPSLGVLELIRLGKVLSLDACISTAQTPPRLNLENILVGLRLAEAFLDRPMGLMHHIVGLVYTSLTMPAIWKGIDEGTFKEADLVRIHEHLSRLAPLRNVNTAITQESCFAYRAIIPNFSAGNDFFSRLFLPLLKPIVVNCLKGLVVLDLWNFRRDAAGKDVFLTENNPDRFSVSAKAFGFYNDARLKDIQLQLVRLEVAVQIFRLRNGEVPNSLTQLTPLILPSLPIDPFTGEPYKYKKLGKGEYLLYSCWTNRVDDGGQSIVLTPPESQGARFSFSEKIPGDFVWPRHFSDRTKN